MKTRTRAIFHLFTLAVLCSAFRLCQAAEGSKPIIDVRFDAPYRQIGSSLGDEWAPSWGRGDALYTGNDDGSSFGGVPVNALAFGRLEGADPDHLKGITVNGMSDYR